MAKIALPAVLPTSFDEILETQAQIMSIVEKYENNKIALRIQQLDRLYEVKADLARNLKRVCKHPTLDIRNDYWTDSGYGLDRHYDYVAITCPTCKTEVFKHSGRATDFLKMSWPQAVEFMKEPQPKEVMLNALIERLGSNSEFCSAFGIRRVTHTTYSYVKVG